MVNLKVLRRKSNISCQINVFSLLVTKWSSEPSGLLIIAFYLKAFAKVSIQTNFDVFIMSSLVGDGSLFECSCNFSMISADSLSQYKALNGRCMSVSFTCKSPVITPCRITKKYPFFRKASFNSRI